MIQNLPFRSLQISISFDATAVYLGVGEESRSMLESTCRRLQLTHPEIVLKNIIPQLGRYVN